MEGGFEIVVVDMIVFDGLCMDVVLNVNIVDMMVIV